MKLESRKFKNSSPLTFDIVVVGAGAAGLEIARYFAEKKFSLLLIERGPEKFSWKHQRDFQFLSVGKQIRQDDFVSLFDLETAKKRLCRYSGFGGTLNLWGRNWKTLTEFDLSNSATLPFGGWPISFEELWGYYEAIAVSHDLDRFLDFSRSVSDRSNPLHIPLPLTASPRCKIKKGSVAKSLKDLLSMIELSENLSIAMEARAVSFELSHDKKRVENLVMEDSFGNEKTVRAKVFVLASGTIENTRLILSNPHFAVPGSGFKMVGKCLMDHPKGQCGYLYPYNKNFSLESQRIKQETQEFIVDYAFSSLHLGKKALPNHCVMIEKDRLCKIPRYKLIFHLEQIPFKESTISLSDRKDVFGSIVASVDWRVSQEDKKMLQQFSEEIAKVFKELKLGDVHYSNDRVSFDTLKDASHQMGTTRMSETSEYGVVDQNLLYFGLNNLFIIGSSVFPKSGNANPTFTILALAMRLAEHLHKLL